MREKTVGMDSGAHKPAPPVKAIPPSKMHEQVERANAEVRGINIASQQAKRTKSFTAMLLAKVRQTVRSAGKSPKRENLRIERPA
jgi:hypothetical protein